MLIKKNIFLLLATCILAGCGGGSNSSPNCTTRDACINDQNCKCWCSVQCGWRKKTANDSPIYIENDPNGKYCYCAQRDIDLYDGNCGDNANKKQNNQEAE